MRTLYIGCTNETATFADDIDRLPPDVCNVDTVSVYNSKQYDAFIGLYKCDRLDVDTNFSRNFEQWLESARLEDE